MTTRRAIPLPAPFRLVWMIALLVGLTGFAFCVAAAVATHHVPTRYLFVISDIEPFGDYTLYLEKFKLLHTTAFFHRDFPFTYPAPVAVGYNFFFHHTGPHPTRVFLVFIAVALLIPAILFARALIRHGLRPRTATLFTVTLLLTSWPALLVWDRANLEILVWCALAFATWAWATDRLYLAATGFALAASMKLFPFVFFGLFLSVRDLRRILFGAAVFLAASVASLVFVGPSVSIAYRGINDGLQFFRVNYMAAWRPLEAAYDHSLFNLYKTTAVLAFHHEPTFLVSLGRFLPGIALVGILLYLFRIRLLPLTNQLACLTIASIYFTAFSGDGTLLHLYYPFALLLFLALGRARAGLPQPRGLRAALVLFALLLTAEPFLLLRTRFGRERLDGPVHGILLGLLFVVALTCPFGPLLATTRKQSEGARPSLLSSLLNPTA